MKKNEFATFLVYLLMIGLAVLVGLAWVRPTMERFGDNLPIPGVVIVIIAMVVGVILNAALLELGHLLGAKTGKYRVRSFVILGFGSHIKDGKKTKGFGSFSGLTGETRVAPIDPEKSRLGGYIAFPLLFLLIEVVVCSVMIAVGNAFEVSSGMGWMTIAGISMLGVAGMIAIYDYFPARLDEVNDGYLMMITSKNINKVAYNHILLAQEAEDLGLPAPKPVVYEEVTDFTFSINLASFYRAVEKKDIKTAIQIAEMAINTEKGLSSQNKELARCLKLTLLLGDASTFQNGKKMYEELEDSTKTYISGLSTMPAIRSYILISSFLEQSEGECNFAIEKADKALKGEEDYAKDIEKALAEANVDFVRDMHPGWDVEKLPWQIKAEQEEIARRDREEATRAIEEAEASEAAAKESEDSEEE